MTDATFERHRPRSRPSPAPPRTSQSGCPGIRGARRMVTIYIPLALFVIVLLFPFYWMAITAIKPDYEMYDYKPSTTRSGSTRRRLPTSTSCCSRPNIRTG